MIEKSMFSIIGIAASIIMAGCHSVAPSYKSEVKVTPLKQDLNKKSQYFVEVDVFRVERGKKPVLVSSPHVAVLEGQEAEMSVLQDGTGFTIKALATKDDGMPMVVTTIAKKTGNIVMWTDTQKTVIKCKKR